MVTEEQFDDQSPWGRWAPGIVERICLKLIGFLPTGSFYKRIAFILRKPIKNGGRFLYDVTIWGFRLRLCSKGNLSEQRWLTMPQFLDVLEREVIAGKLSPGGVFFDVGANAGFYTFWALSLRNPEVRVVAVEPGSKMRQRLAYNLKTNGLDKDVSILTCAVTPERCEVSIEEHEDNLGQTSVHSGYGGTLVEGMPLIDIMDECEVERIDVLKIDIEGGESAVIEALLINCGRDRWPRCVIGEIVGDDSQSFIKVLESVGYELEAATKMNGVFLLK